MRFSIPTLFFLFSLLFISPSASSQSKDLFTYTQVHKLEERKSYSIFYPVIEEEAYQGVIVLIHSLQASNPKVYGDFIEFLLRKKYIVIYPAYQDYVVSNNKKDIEFISQSLHNAYRDIEKNYKDVKSLPFAFIGHSMGGIIVQELTTNKVVLPFNPKCVISICPAEVRQHSLSSINFKELDIYDVYLVIEEQKDRHYKNGTGQKMYDMLLPAERKKYLVHSKSEQERSQHLNLWANNNSFSSKNNTFVTYFPGLWSTSDVVDSVFYWPEINQALECAFSRKDCSSFREE